MMRPGTKVRLSDQFKEKMLASEYAEHVHEFGDSIGLVVEAVEYGYPEMLIEVRWPPDNLKYSYWEDSLVEVPDENRVRTAWFIRR